MRYVVAGLITVSLGLSATARAQQTMILGEKLVFNFLDAKPQPGALGPGQLFQADRGARKGQYVLVSMPEGSAAAGRPVAAAGNRLVEYHLLSPQTVGTLPGVDVLGVHFVKVRPARREAFERFVAEKLHPAVGNLRPDLRILYYKSLRVADVNNYIALFALTKTSRDKYWPGGSDSDALRKAFTPEVKALTTELRSFLVEGSYAEDPKLTAAVFESREWTDFVLVSK